MNWYYMDGDQQQGPVSESTVKVYVATGKLTRQTPVWKEGLEDWRAASDTELARLFGMPSETGANSPLDHTYSSVYGMQDGGGVGDGLRQLSKDIGSLDLSHLFPLSSMFRAGLFRKRAVRWTIGFGILPMLIWHVSDWMSLGLREVLWLMEFYFCLFWASYFIGLVPTEKGVVRRGAGYFFATIVIGVPLLFSYQALPIVRSFYAQTGSYDIGARLMGFVFGVGLAEELFKALPLLVFGLREGKIRTPKEGLFLGMMSGLGFAASEGVMYIIQSAVSASVFDTQAAFSTQFAQFLFRMITGPLLHAAWAGTVGWFIGYAAMRQEPRWPVVGLGIAFMAVLHGVHDVLVGGVLGIATSAVTLIILFVYMTHDENSNVQTGDKPLSSPSNGTI